MQLLAGFDGVEVDAFVFYRRPQSLIEDIVIILGFPDTGKWSLTEYAGCRRFGSAVQLDTIEADHVLSSFKGVQNAQALEAGAINNASASTG